jgi:hypothetical protein
LGNFGAMRMTVENSSIENNGDDGILISGGTSTITRTTLSGNHANGIAAGLAFVEITSTVAIRNQLGAGFSLQRSRGTVESSVSEGNALGLVTGGVGTEVITLSNSAFLNNRSVGILVFATKVLTRQNNTVVDNPTNVQGTLTPIQGS